MTIIPNATIFHHCDGNIVKLWNTLSNEGYPELSRIALGILQKMQAVNELFLL